ncbi:MAG: hypothetical protein RLZZ450_1778 [Pseudomonadota bacterium]|jgi:hypothetical protein
MTTQEVSLGADRPPLHQEPDADAPIEVDRGDAEVVGSSDATADDAAPAKPSVVVEAGQVVSRDAGLATKSDADAAVVATCMLNGHHPFDGLPQPTPLPRPEEWDGGLPSLLDNDPLPPPGLPREYEAGVPPFCCTLTTPWFCAKP